MWTGMPRATPRAVLMPSLRDPVTAFLMTIKESGPGDMSASRCMAATVSSSGI